MAATTASAILQRFETVLTASPINLVQAGDPFSDVSIPSGLVDSSFRVVHGGKVHDRGQSNFATARIDRITVTVQRSLKFDGYGAQRDLQDLLDDIERAIIADGADHFYMVTVEKGSRKTTRKKDSDVIEASINFLCDYDFNEAA